MSAAKSVALVTASIGKSKRHGTACFVSPTELLTAAHVVCSQNGDCADAVQIRVNTASSSDQPRFEGLAAEIVWRDCALDVALLRLTQPPSFKVDFVSLATAPLERAETFNSWGYPKVVKGNANEPRKPAKAKASGFAAASDGQATDYLSLSGTVSPPKDGKLQITVTQAVEGLDPDKIHEWGGASGTPVLVQRGPAVVCVGIVGTVLQGVTNQLVACPVERLRDCSELAHLFLAARSALHARRLEGVRSFLHEQFGKNALLRDKVLDVAQQVQTGLRSDDLIAALVGPGSIALPIGKVCLILERAASLQTNLRDAVVAILESLLPVLLDARRWPELPGVGLVGLCVPLDAWHASIADLLIAAAQQVPARLVRDGAVLRGAAGHTLGLVGALQNEADRRGLLQEMARAFGIQLPTDDPKAMGQRIEAEAQIRLENAALGCGHNLVPLYLLIRAAHADEPALGALCRLLHNDLAMPSLRVFVLRPEYDLDEDRRIEARLCQLWT